MGEHATEEACPQGCVPPPTLTPQGHSAAGSGAGRGLEATWSVFSSLVDGHRDRAPSLLLLGAERARPGSGVGAPLPPLSGLQPRSPISPLSVCLIPRTQGGVRKLAFLAILMPMFRAPSSRPLAFSLSRLCIPAPSPMRVGFLYHLSCFLNSEHGKE